MNENVKGVFNFFEKSWKKEALGVFKISSKNSAGFRRILEWKMGVLSRLDGAMTEEKGVERVENGTKRVFCAAFFAFFCLVSLIFKHAKFSKVNAKFSKGVDFWNRKSPKFFKICGNYLFLSVLAKPLKIRLFSAKNFLAQNF